MYRDLDRAEKKLLAALREYIEALMQTSKPPSDEQIRYVKSLLTQLGLTEEQARQSLNIDVNTLRSKSRREVSAIIERLRNELSQKLKQQIRSMKDRLIAIYGEEKVKATIQKALSNVRSDDDLQKCYAVRNALRTLENSGVAQESQWVDFEENQNSPKDSQESSEWIDLSKESTDDFGF